MKSGTGDDPFADDAATDEDDTDETPDDPAAIPDADAGDAGDSDTEDASTTPDASDDAAGDAETAADGSTPASEPATDPTDGSNDTTADDGATSDDAGAADASADGDDAGASDDAPDIPWVLRRSSVKADRPNVTQFFLRDETDRAERRFQSDVEDILDADVYTLDLREAAYLVAMRHPEEVAAELRDWGYEYME